MDACRSIFSSVGWFLLFFGAGIMLIGAYRVAALPGEQWQTTMGSVIDYDVLKTRSTSSGVKYKPCAIYTYEVDGKTYTNKDCSITFRTYKSMDHSLEKARSRYTGDTLVWYQKQVPSKSSLNIHSFSDWFILIGVGLCLGTAGAGLLRKFKRIND